METIRFAWGNSSLGRFFFAVSDQGIVAFEFDDQARDPLEELRTRLPEARFR